MIPKRVKQFYINMTDNMTKEDRKYVENILSAKELNLFYKLLKSEQKHSVRIAREIESNILDKTVSTKIINKKDVLLKASLLHDIGKTIKKVNIIEKSIIVILNKLTDGNLKNVKISKKVQCYYNHSNYSYGILKDGNYDELLLHIVKNHHNNDYNDEILDFFKRIDDKN